MIIHTVNYWYLEIALEEREASYSALTSEIQAFTPKPLSDFEERRKPHFEHLKKLNPDKSDSYLEKAVAEDMELRYSPKLQFHCLFNDRFSIEAVNIIMLSQALCEGLINLILSTELFSKGDQELFRLLDPSNLKDKWVIAPSIVFPGYKLDKSGVVYETLNALCKKRNGLVHSKTTIKDKEWNTIVDGSPDLFEKIDANTVEMFRRFLRLPYDLLENLCESISDPGKKHMMMANLRKGKR